MRTGGEMGQGSVSKIHGCLAFNIEHLVKSLHRVQSLETLYLCAEDVFLRRLRAYGHSMSQLSLS